MTERRFVLDGSFWHSVEDVCCDARTDHALRQQLTHQSLNYLITALCGFVNKVNKPPVDCSESRLHCCDTDQIF